MSLNVKGQHRWINDVMTLLDTGGCENCISRRFAARLGLKVMLDRRPGSDTTSVAGGTVSFRHYVDIRCDFEGVKRVIRFYVQPSLPHDLLLGNPCLVTQLGAVLDLVDGLATFKYLNVVCPLIPSNRVREVYQTFGAFDVDHASSGPIATQFCDNYVPGVSSSAFVASQFDNPYAGALEEDHGTIDGFKKYSALFMKSVNANNLVAFTDAFEHVQPGRIEPMDSELQEASDNPVLGEFVDSTGALPDMISQLCFFDRELGVEESPPAATDTGENPVTEDSDLSAHGERLDMLLDEYGDRFGLNDFTPANVPPVHVPLRPEHRNRVFYLPEPMRSVQDQQVIDDNARRLIDRGWAKMNPRSRHNIPQVTVKRFDKRGVPIPGRDRVYLNLRPMNKMV